MKKTTLAGWKAFLASPAAPPTAMGAVELEGYLTGLAVVPEIVLPSIWITGLWGEEEWTCTGFVPVTDLIMPPWLRMRAG